MPSVTGATERAVIVPTWLLPIAGVALVAALALAVPERRTPLLTVAAFVPLAAAVHLARRLRADRDLVPTHARGGWLLVTAAAAVGAGGSILSLLTRANDAPLAPTDLPFALSALLCMAGVFQLIGGRARGRSVDSLVEGLLATAPLAYLAAVALLDHRSPSVALSAALHSVIAVAAHVVFVVMCVELVRMHDQHPTPARMLRAGAVGLLVVQVVRSGILLTGDAVELPASLLAGASLLVATAWVAAVLHPDVRQHFDPAEVLATPLTRTRVTLVVVAVSMGPLVIADRAASFQTDGLSGITGGAIVLATVAVAYLVRLVEQRARIEYLALHDDLCAIPNRVLLDDRIGSALAAARRHERRVALLFLDLDRFKTINDSLGHAAGNDLLHAAAARLTESVRSSDTVARLGGDEFAVLLPDVSDVTAPSAVAEKILHAFEAPFEVADRQIFVTPSIGVSLFPDDADDAQQLLRNADAAMYRAKEHGRNTFELYTGEINDRAHQRLTIESHLHKAIERGELVLHYQPKVELRSGRIVGMEALMRWNHPTLGSVSPANFIPIAEDNGLIVPLGEWALAEACAQAKSWADAGHPPLTVAVNVSARQFQQQKVATLVARTLRATGLPPALLELELTESLALEDPEVTTATLLDLREMGVSCSIDDFGTGYSGLRYLTRFPIDRLKIDKYFISEITNGVGNANIVAAVIALAHGLRMDVIAEGVERDEQRLFLQQHGCDQMQGFLFSKALPPADFEELLDKDVPFAGLALPLPRLRTVGDERTI